MAWIVTLWMGLERDASLVEPASPSRLSRELRGLSVDSHIVRRLAANCEWQSASSPHASPLG